MQSKKIEQIITQWVLPTILLVILLSVFISRYRGQSETVVDSFVENSIEQTGGTYSRNISSTLKSMKSITDIVEEMLERRGDVSLTYLTQSLHAIEDSGAAFSVAYCYTNGEGIMAGSERLNLKNTDYFSSLQGTDSFFTYTKNDGITGQEAILYVCPVEYESEVNGYLIAYMNPTELTEIFQDGKSYGNEVFYAIVNNEGSIVASFGGVESTTLLADDFWNYIKQGTEINTTWNFFESMRQNRQYFEIHLVKDAEERILCQFPIKDTEWFLVMGVNQHYVDKMFGKVWNPMVGLLVQMGICLVCYLAVVITLNVMTRIRNTEQNRALENRADTDQLTDLNNKIATERKIREYMGKHPDKQGVLFIVDVDNFKKINDTLGHAFGDEVLRCLGIRLSSMFRVTDIVGRIGGDEFLIFLKDVRDDDAVALEGRKIEQLFHHFEVGEYVKYSVTASVGGAVFPRDANTFEDLYKAADTAVYMSKKRGKNCVSFFHEDKK